MQTLKEVFSREEERIHIRNGALCISIVVLVVLLAFGLRGLHFALHQSPPVASITLTTDGETPH